MKNSFSILAAALVLVSCSDRELAAIDDRLADNEHALVQLAERITTVEQTVLQLNSDIRSLVVLRGGVTISGIEGNDAAGWTMTTGDGRTVVIPPQGSKGNAPVISLDDDGCWMVDYGNGPAYILDRNGNKVSQAGKGADGRDADSSPVLGVTGDGYWKVSNDSGATWELLADVDGNPVPVAVEIGETLFSSVKVEGNNVRIVVKNGASFAIPLVRNFICAISGVLPVESFTSGQTREFALRLEGVLELFVTCPEGWTAGVSDTTLRITAPAASKVYFDTEEYVAVYAVSTDGHSAAASMKVAITE